MKIIVIRTYGILIMEQVITCGYKKKFVKLEEKVRRNVSFGESKVQIQAKCTILISLKDGFHKFIKDVYYVPKLRSNILLWDNLSNSNLVAKVFMSRNRMFMLSIKTNEAKCLKASIKDEAWCWHMRFGHLNFGALKALGDEKMVKGMPHINHPNQLCEACLLGKHARRSFPKEVESITMSLSNLCTLICMVQLILLHLININILLLFIDDFSRKT
ncbi:hypothetical protein CR513_38114, partial [Mucuna pruriens]